MRTPGTAWDRLTGGIGWRRLRGRRVGSRRSVIFLTRLVRAAGREPYERDTLYNIVNVPPIEAPEPAAQAR